MASTPARRQKARAVPNAESGGSRTPKVRSGAAGRAKGGKPGRLAEIIAATANVFARYGYHGASTQDIADVLNIKQASLYYYFPSKEAALEAVCARGAEGFFEDAAAVAAQPVSAGEKIAGIARIHLLPLLDRSDFVTVFLRERRHLPRESRIRVSRWVRAYEKIIEDVIREGIATGEFRGDLNPRLAMLGYLGMLRTVADWYGKESGISLDDAIAELPKLMTAGLEGGTASAATMRTRAKTG